MPWCAQICSHISAGLQDGVRMGSGVAAKRTASAGEGHRGLIVRVACDGSLGNWDVDRTYRQLSD